MVFLNFLIFIPCQAPDGTVRTEGSATQVAARELRGMGAGLGTIPSLFAELDARYRGETVLGIIEDLGWVKVDLSRVVVWRLESSILISIDLDQD